MDLVVVKKGVVYASGVASGLLANINSLAEGSVICGWDNGTTIIDTGAITGGANAGVGKKGFIWYKRQGEVKKTTAIDMATCKLITPRGSAAAATQVSTLTTAAAITAPSAVNGLNVTVDTGILFTDPTKHVDDPSARVLIEHPLSTPDTVATWRTALVAKINAAIGAGKLPFLTSVVNTSTTVLTFNGVAGRQFVATGTGRFQETGSCVFASTTAFKQGDTVTAAELLALVEQVKGSDGNYSNHMDGAPAMFSKDYGVEAGEVYSVWAISSKAEAGYSSNDKVTHTNLVYFAVVATQNTDGTLAGTTKEGYYDIIANLAGLATTDTGGAGKVGADV